VRYTRDADIIEVDLDGARVGGSEDGYAPPLEIFIHTELYRSRADVNAVVHTHPASAVALTICDKPLEPIYGAYEPFSLLYALAGVPTYPKSILIRRPDLGRELANCMGSSEVCLMHGHGITTAANSVEEATLAAIHLETLTSMTCQANMMGGAKALPPEEREEFRAMAGQDGYSERRPGLPPGRIANLWRFYTRLAEDRLR
jgi:ribulose-5-phosphate 4-epimerase/fuculose-1-phosphate aldolase